MYFTLSLLPKMLFLSCVQSLLGGISPSPHFFVLHVPVGWISNSTYPIGFLSLGIWNWNLGRLSRPPELRPYNGSWSSICHHWPKKQRRLTYRKRKPVCRQNEMGEPREVVTHAVAGRGCQSPRPGPRPCWSGASPALAV